ncbi:MBL fold metallo-hydrolase [Dactylosporangium sp. NPDC049525]|uniref:MBL fold metallo-hydrolase n=1 Tax=Dactylosporangium sp. NPDC049525 TaxID=3154730 RepID=UPI0034460414
MSSDGRLREIGDGVYAYVQPDGGWCVNNAGLVHDGDAALLVDTAATHARALALRDAVRGITPRPPGVVVNTHHHGDHTLGNAVFAPPATVVTHAATRHDMAARGTALRHVWPDVDWGEQPLVLPDLTFTERLTVHVGRSEVRLWHPGPAHTNGDVVAWLPAQRVLFTGDIVMPGHTPFVLMGSVHGSLHAVAALAALEPEVVVGGHGPVAGPEAIEATTAYLRWLDDLAERGLAAGLTPLAAALDADLGDFAGWGEPERLVANLHRAYAERTGAPAGTYLPSAPVFAEMVTWHGGPLPCAA